MPYLARHFRVVTRDPRGNGASDRPAGRGAYADDVYARHAAAVLDATGTEVAFVVALCSGIKWSLLLATAEPKRVRGLVATAPGEHPLAPHPHPLQTVDQQQWCGDYAGWVDYHPDVLLPEPRASKAFEDLVAGHCKPMRRSSPPGRTPLYRPRPTTRRWCSTPPAITPLQDHGFRPARGDTDLAPPCTVLVTGSSEQYLELGRLDALQSGLLARGHGQDLCAADYVLKVIARPCTILSVDHVQDDLTGTARTILVGGNTEECIAGLKAVIAATGAPRLS